MSIAFPNPSRSYDPAQRRVAFWGHDRAMEVRFFIEENALYKLAPRTQKIEAAILAAFDAARERIMEVAAATYAPSDRRSDYILSASDF